jgi:hypothetical protein
MFRRKKQHARFRVGKIVNGSMPSLSEIALEQIAADC